METRVYNEKEIIFRESEEAHEAYVVRSGQVEILKHAEHGEVQLAILEEGNVFGEMALFEKKNARSATARALNEVSVEVISETSFYEMMDRTPEQLKKCVTAVLQRLRETTQRLASKERATVFLDDSIETIHITPANDALSFDKIDLQVANLPFTIGGYPKEEEHPHHNDLDLPSDGPPLMISQIHVSIERAQDGVYVVDKGSRFCTIVNGKVIGRGKADTRAMLQMGENKLTLGDHTSRYKLLLNCE